LGSLQFASICSSISEPFSFFYSFSAPLISEKVIDATAAGTGE
jgi:hypothetical protein